LPTMMSSERALVIATLNLCTESKLQCRSEAMGCAHSSLPVAIYKASYLVCNVCDMHYCSCPLPGTVPGSLVTNVFWHYPVSFFYYFMSKSVNTDHDRRKHRNTSITDKLVKVQGSGQEQ
jgi:hypothetical protein